MTNPSTLPPPIHDPNTGKIYVAIPAPAFILVGNRISLSDPSINDNSGFVYVEYQPTKDGLLSEKSPISDDLKSHINKWREGQNISLEPPPGHIPWAGVTGNCKKRLNSIKPGTIHKIPSREDLVSDNGTFSSIESLSHLQIQASSSDDTLLNGSLPSVCSSAWSGSIPIPRISLVNARTSSVLPTSVPISTPKPFVNLKNLDKRRYTICAPNLVGRREAHVLERRRTAEKINHDPVFFHPVATTRTLSRINDLDNFFSSGLKCMQSTMNQLNKTLETPQTPSLFVSTSTKTVPLSFESPSTSRDPLTHPDKSTPLATRRGKPTPASIKIVDQVAFTTATLEYPEIPTPFRGSPEPTRNLFPDNADYPKITLNKGMSTEQMIRCLRSQMEGLYPSGNSLAIFDGQCKHAEGWLVKEANESTFSLSRSDVVLENKAYRKGDKGDNKPKYQGCVDKGSQTRERESSPPHVLTPKPGPLRSTFSSPPRFKPISHSKPRLTKGLETCSTGYIKVSRENMENQERTPYCERVKPHKSILSCGTPVSTSAKKRVRFSDSAEFLGSISVTPERKPIIQQARTEPAPKMVSTRVSSPKRKPPPSMNPDLVNTLKPKQDLHDSVHGKALVDPKYDPYSMDMRKTTRLTTRPQNSPLLSVKDEFTTNTSAVKTLDMRMSLESNSSFTKTRNPKPGLSQHPDPEQLVGLVRDHSGPRETELLTTLVINTTSAECVDASVLLSSNQNINLKKPRNAIKVAGISFPKSKRKSYLISGNIGKDNNLQEANNEKENIMLEVAQEVHKKNGRRSLAIGNVLNRLRG
ncbi:hypothetical protein PNOK_0510100 [Pyrrhoderma noxium]|uniref:Uncharacterized protein n=1 Tax=Pyrrhoderma noxium TaxID=2282107 RepID=A0A286UKN4_9AGAM|nr:hypothetical protein PNOK_0510100 [Pyrrhoderma noxium]